MFEVLLQNTFVVSRESSSVYTATPPVADDSSPSITITTPGYLEVTISGFMDGTGTVTLDGTDESDDALNEVVTFPGNGQKVTGNKFKTVTRVRTSGLADEATTGTLKIQTATGVGTDQPVWETVGTIVGRLVRPRTKAAFTMLGERSSKSGAVHTKPGEDILVGDRITLGSDIWEVEEINRRFGRIGEVHHWQVVVTELESPAN